MHRIWPMQSPPASASLLHIADPTGETIAATGSRRVGLLGTAFTMEQDFYKARLTRLKFGRGSNVIVPDSAGDRFVVHEIIYRELVAGDRRSSSRAAYREIIDPLGRASARRP